MPDNTRKKIRLTITDDEHKVLFTTKTTRGTIGWCIAGAAVLLIFITVALIVWTPLKKKIPGYPSEESRKEAVENRITIDSLEREMQVWNMQLSNIRRIMNGEEPLAPDSLKSIRKEPNAGNSDTKLGNLYAGSDSALRDEVRKQEEFSVNYQHNHIGQIEGMHFFTPVQGVITSGFNLALNHPAVDIAAAEGSIVYAVLDGTVISSGWNDETGFTIQIQHSDNLISIYKHAEKLLKGTGDKVTAGTPIALVGSTGKFSTGDHLHFELWHNGEPVDPTLYINF
ncbi:MAG: M23 family metallopeptidase [Bacteroidales bacterium]|jgi:murein DD-endopeptidase MepM/ murein hydrolase activator NlpD|nr:M23 family metallopeptidase [Bacteroidales bacterium]MCI2146354.1 M23 family metallopeptidase [Bacteroidales bacterium]